MQNQTGTGLRLVLWSAIAAYFLRIESTKMASALNRNATFSVPGSVGSPWRSGMGTCRLHVCTAGKMNYSVVGGSFISTEHDMSIMTNESLQCAWHSAATLQYPKFITKNWGVFD